MKADIYQSLYVFNRSLQQVAEQLDKLKALGLLPPHMADIHRISAEELGAQVNHSATLALHAREAEDAVQFQQQRIKLEQQLQP